MIAFPPCRCQESPAGDNSASFSFGENRCSMFRINRLGVKEILPWKR
jgi:hypothetical protein